MICIYKRSELGLLSISLFFLIFNLFIYIFNKEFVPITILKVTLCLYIVYSVFQLHKTIRITNCIFIYIAGFLLFNCSRVFLSLFNPEIILESDKYIYYTFSNITVCSVLLLLGITFSSVILGYLIQNNKIIPQSVHRIDVIDKRIVKVLRMIVFLSIPGLVYKFILELILIKQYGYLIMFMELPPTPFLARLSWGVFNITFPMLLMFVPSLGQFKKYLLFFMIISFPSFLKGSRSTLLAPVLFFLWYYYNNYTKKNISFKKVLLALLLIAFVANAMLLLRGSEEMVYDIGMILYLLFYTQGVTFVMLGNYIDFASSFVYKSSWYILFPIVSTYHWLFTPIYREGQSYELVKQTLNLDDQLMYSVAPELYLKGAGYGSSYIAELYSLGGILAVLVGSIILGIFIKLYEKYCCKSKIMMYLSWFLVHHFLWMSRGSYLPNLFLPLCGIIMYKLLRYFIRTHSSRVKLLTY